MWAAPREWRSNSRPLHPKVVKEGREGRRMLLARDDTKEERHSYVELVGTIDWLEKSIAVLQISVDFKRVHFAVRLIAQCH